MNSTNKNLSWKASVLLIIVTLSFLVTTSNAYAGVVLSQTRIIYPAESSEVTLGLKNTDVAQTFLVQSIIESANGKKQKNFSVNPPLFILKPRGENKIRVFYKSLTTLATDKETLFWVNIKAIPSSNQEEKGNFIHFAVTNRIKLLYRPKGLSVPGETVWQKIKFSRRGDKVVMYNPTPYYMNILSVKSGKVFKENLTLSPYESHAIETNSTEGSNAEVVFINDLGGESKTITVPLT